MFEKLALLTPAIIPEDPDAVIRPDDGAARLLDNTALVVERRIEMLNVFLVFTLAIQLTKGYEQCNRYVIMDPQGEHVGYHLRKCE
jgi:Scramblase